MKRIMPRKLLLIVMAFVLALAAPLSLAIAEGEPDTIRIGLVYPLTGPLAKLGQEELKGATIALEEINAAGGINGKPVEWVSVDAPTPDAAVAETERLITVDKVKVIMGSYSSGVAYAGSAVAEKHKVVWWENSGVATNITERGFKYLFRFGITGRNLGETQVMMIEDIVAPKLGMDPKEFKIALIYEDSAFGSSVADGTRALAKEHGLNIVLDEGYNAASTDLSSLILKMKQSGANILAPTPYVADALLLFRQMQELNFKPLAVVMAGNAVQDLKNALGDQIAGLLHSDITQPRTNENAAKGLAAFIKAYDEKYGGKPWSGHTIRAYSGALVLFDVIARAGSYDADKIAAAARETDLPMFSTATGWGCKFDEVGQNERAISFGCVWFEGDPTTIWPVEAAWEGVEFELPWK